MSQSAHARRPDATDLAAALVFLAAMGLAGFIWRDGPSGLLPVHLSITGAVDRWGDRASVGRFLGLITGGLAIGYLVLGMVTLGARPDAAARRSLKSARQALIMVSVLITGIAVAMTYGDFTSPARLGLRLTTGLLALLFLGLGALMGKTAPNPLVGVRTWWTARSRLAWDKSNRLAGRLFFWIGALGLISVPLFEPRAVITALIVAVLVAAATSVVGSWRVWRNDPERQRP